MSKKESIARLTRIINKLRKGPANYNEINEYLKRESELEDYNFTVSKRTFTRDLEDIRMLYNIDIVYNKKAKYYHIDFDENPVFQNRILEAFDTFSAFNMTERISEHIYFETRKAPGTEHLFGLLHAIKNKMKIKFDYGAFLEEKLKPRKVKPLSLKEFKNRWYIIVQDTKDEIIKSFSLDRISNLEFTNEKFEALIHFDVNEHYRYSFGIISPNADKPQNIVLSFNAFQGKYIKSLPLHFSQKTIIDNDEEFRISLELFITFDFIMELLSYGNNVKVISPKHLRNELKESYKSTLKLYE